MNFEALREDDCYYVDKTRFIEKNEQTNKFFFYIRPRRFGKIFRPLNESPKRLVLLTLLAKSASVFKICKSEMIFCKCRKGYPTNRILMKIGQSDNLI